MPGVIVKGATISEKTYADSFASLFSEILPQKSSSTKVPNRLNGFSSNGETHEPIAWTYLINKTNKEEYGTSLINEVLSLVIGYSTGFQVWSVLEHGDALEIFSLRCGPVSAFRELPTPRNKKRDKYSSKRPLAVYTASQNGAKNSFKTLNYISLLSGEQIHSLNFTTSIQDVVVNARIVVVTFYDRLAVFDNASLEHKFSITSCYPAIVNPVSVADVWLAYVDRNLAPRLQSGGGVTSDFRNSYASTIVKSASYGLNVGLNLLSQYAVGSSATNNNQLLPPSLPPSCSSPVGSSPAFDHRSSSESASPGSPSSSPHSYHHLSSTGAGGGVAYSAAPYAFNSRNSPSSHTFHINHSRNHSGCSPGVVTVVDILRVPGPTDACKHVTVGTNDPNGSLEEIVAHFSAYLNESVVSMHLTNRGIIATAGEYGHVFNVFKIHSHPWSSSFCAVHHLYALRRGETIAKINHISISEDLRWVVASSSKGTTHLFATNSYGGQPTPRSHCGSKVVNKEDKFYCSAGLDDVRAPNLVAATAAAAHLSTSPSSPSFESHKLMSTNSGRCSASFRAVLNGSIGHPWLPPYPVPTTLDPVAQIKLPSMSVPAVCFPSGLNMNEISVTNLFAAPCFNLDAFQLEFGGGLNSDFLSGPFDVNGILSSPGSKSSDKAENTRAYTFSLYTFFGTVPGVLLETSVRVCRDLSNRDCIEISNYPTAQWRLGRCASWAEVKPRTSEEDSPKSDFGSERGSSSRGKSESNLVYQSQMSHDSGKTMTDHSLQNSAEHDVLTATTREDYLSSGTTVGIRKESGTDRCCQLETRTTEYNIWMSQVEMNTHASPHRRLWMGPQFTFKTIQGNKGGTSPNFALEDMGSGGGAAADGNVGGYSSGRMVANMETTLMSDSGTGGLISVALHSVPSFQTVDKFQLEQLRINSCISPLVKSRNVVTPPSQRRLGASSSLTPSSSSGASPPDQLSAVNNSSPCPFGNNAAAVNKSNPVPIFNYSNSTTFGGGIKNRKKSDSGDSISSTGSTGSSYPFYIEVGSGDFERCRTMLNVNSVPMLGNAGNADFSGASGSVASNSLGGRLQSKTLSRKESANSVEDFASWGEDTNLDDALNSIDNESPLVSEDFHDALDEMNGLQLNENEKLRKRSGTGISSGGESVDLIAIGNDDNNSPVLINGETPTAMNGTKSSRNKKSKNRANRSNKSKKEKEAVVSQKHGPKDGNGANAEEGLEDLLAEAMMENTSPATKETRPVVVSSDDSSSMTGELGGDKWMKKDIVSSSSENNFYPVSPPPPAAPPSDSGRQHRSGSSHSSFNESLPPHQTNSS